MRRLDYSNREVLIMFLLILCHAVVFELLYINHYFSLLWAKLLYAAVLLLFLLIGGAIEIRACKREGRSIKKRMAMLVVLSVVGFITMMIITYKLGE